MNLIEIYYSQKLYKLILSEVNKEELMKLTDKGRIQRSKNMNTKSPIVKDLGNGLVRLEYSFKANSSTEKKRHNGFVEYDEKTGDIKKLWCNCKDFSYRLYAPYVNNDISTWNLDKKFDKLKPFDHNREWTNKTNPEGITYCCKHLYQLLQNYIN
jgi:hypothetical protein